MSIEPPEPTGIEIEVSDPNTSGDAVESSSSVFESPYEDFANVVVRGQATEGKLAHEITNKGIPLALTTYVISASQGGEDNRVFGSLAETLSLHENSGTMTDTKPRDAYLWEFGVNTGTGYNRNAQPFHWRDVGMFPYLATEAEIAHRFDASEPAATDTIKFSANLMFVPAENAPGVVGNQHNWTPGDRL